MKYNIMTYEGLVEVDGELVKELEKYGKYYIRRKGDLWQIDEYSTGFEVNHSKTRKKVIELVIKNIEAHGIEQTQQLIEKAIAKHGYANKDEVRDERG